MRGLMMDYALSVPAILRRADAHFAHKRVATRRSDRSVVHHSYSQVVDRVKRLAVALADLGVGKGDRASPKAQVLRYRGI